MQEKNKNPQIQRELLYFPGKEDEFNILLLFSMMDLFDNAVFIINVAF